MFFKSPWNVIGHSLHDFILKVIASPYLVGFVNSTLLILIPKIDEPSSAAQFRPIVLCNVMYRVLNKILADRIKNLFPYVIGLLQPNFLKGRNMIDNSIILQELVHSFNKLS